MSKKVLLVADDDEMNRKVISRFMKNDYDIVEAVDGVEVLEILQTQSIDLILLDIIMPRLNGLEVLEKIRENSDYNHVGVLVATSAKEKTERQALSLGADDIVSKPYDPYVISKRLHNIEMVKDLLSHSELTVESEDVESIKQSLSSLSMVARVIEENIDNYALVKEMVKTINLQVENISDNKILK